jgi:MYXO-CTERM domain-containing protein
MRAERGPLALALVLGVVASLAVAAPAHAYCRTTTCGLPPGFAPSEGSCYPDDFVQRCAALNPPVKVLPVYWANACISYDIQQNASVQVPYADASQLFAAAFAKWTSTTCASAGGGRVSIDVKDLGPVACDEVQYNSNQGNQHVIIFHDDVWPHDDSSNTLGLTTITFDPDTGEIYDADMEINSTPEVPLSLGDPPPDGYDFQSIIQHETGHFFGMAHSGDPNATMLARYTPGTTSMRTLSSDDTAGICSIYLPDGNRAVDPSVAAPGTLMEAACDPTPRHGFQSECAQPVSSSTCSLGAAPGGPPGEEHPLFEGGALLSLALAASLRRRRRARAEARLGYERVAPSGTAKQKRKRRAA